MRRRASSLRFQALAAAAVAICACAAREQESPAPPGPRTEARSEPAAPASETRTGAWIDPRGTSIVGFGILRLVPSGAGPATFRIRYREVPDGYATTGNLQLFVLPGEAFAAKERACAGEFLAFTRTKDEEDTDEEGALRLATSVRVPAETTVLVCYGPWTAPDAGRPAGDVPTFSLDVTSDDGAFEWVESEAGELITTNWTNRPEIRDVTACADPVANAPVRLEVRPMILYDGRMVRSFAETEDCDLGAAKALRDEADALAKAGRAELAADRRERAEDLEACARRADRRLVVTPALAERFRRVPIRWR